MTKPKKALDVDAVLPWGKHKGLAIEDVPSDYLSWLLGKLENGSGRHGDYPALQFGIRKELAYRTKYEAHFIGAPKQPGQTFVKRRR